MEIQKKKKRTGEHFSSNAVETLCSSDDKNNWDGSESSSSVSIWGVQLFNSEVYVFSL